MFGAVVGAVIGAAGAMYAADEQSSAAKHAANTQSAAARQAQQTQTDQYNAQVARERPFYNAGVQGLNALQQQMGRLTDPYTLQKFYQSPEYLAQLGANRQATDSLQAGAAAKGMYGSGAMANALSSNAQQSALQAYQQALQNYQNQNQNQYNMMAGMAGIGQNAAANLGAVGQNMANQVGQYQLDAGTAQAQGDVTSANALSSGVLGAIRQGQGYAGKNAQDQLWTNYMAAQGAGANGGAGAGTNLNSSLAPYYQGYGGGSMPTFQQDNSLNAFANKLSLS